MPKFNNQVIVEGPSGLKMPEPLARTIEAAGKGAPRGDDYSYRRVSVKSDDFKLDAGSRTDVSFITTDAVDRERDVVIPGGIDTRQYNGVVTFAHIYDALPVGRCLWIKPRDNGLIAKTAYAPKPQGWADNWFPDAIISLMQMQPPTCTGKSIGFIPLGYREPTQDEIRARPELGQRVSIIDKAILLEYAVAPVPANPEAEMVAVSKTIPGDMLEIYAKALKALKPGIEAIVAKTPVSFIRPETIAKAIADITERRRKKLVDEIGRRAAEAIIDRFHAAKGTP